MTDTTLEETARDRWISRIFAAIGIGFVPALVIIAPAVEKHIRVSRCETVVKTMVKAPAAFETVHSAVNYGDVTLIFDTPNAFGVPLRGRARCFFPHNSLRISSVIIDGRMPTVVERRIIEARLRERGDADILAKDWDEAGDQ